MTVEVIDNFFTEEDIKQIKQYCDEMQDVVDRVSKDVWHTNLTLGRGNVNILSIDKNLDQDIYNIIFNKMSDHFNLTPLGVLFHFWQPESFISWHNDGMYSAAATVYLNDKWHIDNGGLFLYKADDGIRAEVPAFNRCLFQKGGTLHSTTSTHWKAPVRKSLQVFFK